MECLQCDIHEDGAILAMIENATSHLESFPEHNVRVIEDACRQSLV
jgi:hypothetical protein